MSLPNSSIYIRPLRLEEARAVYIGRAHQDFPPEELKSFSVIENLWNNGCYRGYGFYAEEDDTLRAYALTMADDSARMLLLDYFAVCGEVRGKGYGGRALALLEENCKEWDGMIIEVEDDDCAVTEEERQIRKRRISFYERNGVEMTGQKSSAFEVVYKLMILPLGNENAGEHIGDKIDALYHKMLPEPVYREKFRLL